ncbi:MAG: twin-arginine translocase TatA/TatE family subunit [Nitrospira sp.]|nr:twin-arginine translocase TatA/TatE family subunit [Nitrospira sp.]MCP9464961.1 twin-arginine translocase TatA/TatE family subunit [Nitrospira sp.]
MVGTLGFSELIIILVIILIIFGAGRLPQIGEGVGKALRSFKKEVQDIPPATANTPEPETPAPQPSQAHAADLPPPAGMASLSKPLTATGPGPEMTPGTTASMMYHIGPEPAQQPRTASISPPSPSPASQPVMSMEDRAATPVPLPRTQYPPLPPDSRPKPPTKRPTAIINRDAVARVQAQQAALKAQAAAASSSDTMHQVGENIGQVVRTFRQTAEDLRGSIEPQVHTIQAEVDAASKELQQSLDAAKELPPAHKHRSPSS